MNYRKNDRIDPKGPKQRKRPKQLQIHNLPSDNVEHINSKNEGRDLLLGNNQRIIPQGIERMLQTTQRHCRVTLH